LKLESYFLLLSDIVKIFNIRQAELPNKYQGNINFFDVLEEGKTKRVAGIEEEHLTVIRNFSKVSNADKYLTIIKEAIHNHKTSYSHFFKDIVLTQDQTNKLIETVEEKTKEVTILEGKLNELSCSTNRFKEFTNFTTMIPLIKVHKKLKKKIDYVKLLSILRIEGVLNNKNEVDPSLIENGSFRMFKWEANASRSLTSNSQLMVSEKGIKFIDEVLERVLGKEKKK